jgi:hypothetical protein
VERIVLADSFTYTALRYRKQQLPEMLDKDSNGNDSSLRQRAHCALA